MKICRQKDLKLKEHRTHSKSCYQELIKIKDREK